MITYSNAVGTAGLSQQHLTGPGWGRSPRQATVHPTLHPTGVYSQQTLFGFQTHQVPAQRTSLSNSQIGWGRARSVKPKTRPSRGGPDQARPVPGAVTYLPQSHILGSGPKAFLPGRPIFTKFDTEELSRPNFKSKVPSRTLQGFSFSGQRSITQFQPLTP